MLTLVHNAFIETCFDGLKNQNEKDVDCGGICDPCDSKYNSISYLLI